MMLKTRFTGSIALVVASLLCSSPCQAEIGSGVTEGHELADAAERKRWDAVEGLLRKGSSADQSQPDGMTALHWACFWNHPQTVASLLKVGADPDARTAYDITPLSIACENGFPRLVKRLLDAGADPNAQRPGKITPLMTAARTGRAASIATLIAAGAKVDARDHRGQTALMWAAAEGNAEGVSILLHADADPNLTVKSGFTALLFAARHGKLEAARVLLDAGVDANLAMDPANSGGRNPRKGMSAVMLALESGHFEFALAMIEAGADPNDQRSGFTPLHALSWVRKTKRGDGVDGDPPPRGSGSVTSLQFVRSIVAFGADVNARLKRGGGGKAKMHTKGATPFLMAARTSDLPLMQLLLELGADPTITNVDECTPLMAVAGIGVTAVGEEPGTESEVIEAMRWLVERGANVDAVDKNGETAMHGVAYRNYPLAVEALAKLGADPEVWNQKNDYGWTPVMIAQGNRPGSFKPSPETIAALRQAIRRGASP